MAEARRSRSRGSDGRCLPDGNPGCRSLGEYVDPSRTTLDEYLDRWLAHLRETDSVTPRTWTLYEALLRIHVRPQIGLRRLQKLSALDVQRVIDGMAVSSETRRKAYHVLRAALERAVGWNLLARNPARGGKLPKREMQQVKHALTREQVRAFRTSAASTR
jgi:hypothetical protein